MQIWMNNKISSFWLIWNAKTLGLLFMFCSWSAGWINHVLEYNSWFLLKSTVNLKSISDQPLLLGCWLNQLCGWNKPAVDFCLNQRSTRNQLGINRPSLIVAWINNLVESTRTAVDFRLNQWWTRNQRFWLIQPHWINSPDISDVKPGLHQSGSFPPASKTKIGSSPAVRMLYWLLPSPQKLKRSRLARMTEGGFLGAAGAT